MALSPVIGNRRTTSRGSWSKLYDVAGFILVVLVFGSLFVTIFHEKPHEEQKVVETDQIRRSNGVAEEEISDSISRTGRCNLFSGRWVYDDKSYPLYREDECSFVPDDFACVKYGRKDLNYQHWRWQPHQCNLPRFDAKALMEKIRGKKVVYVGDSLNRNLWISMLCMIESSLSPSSTKSATETGNWYIFEADEYNATIAFYWSPFLVESNNDDPHRHRLRNRIIRIKSIEKHAREWSDADIIIFDSFMWWIEPTMTLLWGSFGSSDAIYKKVEMKHRIYEMGLNTWSDWLELHINQTKTKLFFMSLSPFHEVGNGWDDRKQNCYKVNEPIQDEGYWGFTTDRKMMEVAESAIEKLHERGIKIEYLNITHMSDLRKDGHPSIYRKFYHPLSDEQLKDPRSYSDCAHWCVPGVPDTWNHILYTYLISDDDQSATSTI